MIVAIQYFTSFSWKIGSDTSCKLSPYEAICMKCQILFSRKNSWTYSILFLLLKTFKNSNTTYTPVYVYAS